jgi:excinuclease ABC subunit B
VRRVDVRGRVADEEDEQRHALLDQDVASLAHELGPLGIALVVEDHVDAERPPGQRARRRQPLAQEVGREPGHAHDAQSSRVRDGGRELRPRPCGDARAQDRVLDPEQVAERGSRHAHLYPVSVAELKTAAAYRPTGDQPRAIEQIARSLESGERYQTLLGATGTGKTATMAWIIEQVQRPALVIAHNKTLAAQLCNEFREFFPHNAVEYFVSYYDYYQPEAYVPQADLYIEKDSSRNDDIDRLRHAATSSLLTRRDTIVVASVSCIYGLGSPEEYEAKLVALTVGEETDRDVMLRKLIDIQYVRNDTLLGRGRFRVKGDVVEIQPAYSETAYRVSMFGDEVEQITHFDPLTGEVYAKLDHITVFPATQYVTSKPTIERALDEIRHELEQQVSLFESQGRMLEAHRIRQRTEYDLEMMRELGFCNGIENYSRILDGRPAGSAPHTLLDYFPSDYVVFVDESHQTVPQIGGMYEGDRSRKQTLVDHGFRLPSALDNRPLRFDEFLAKVGQLVFVSATPGPFELRHSKTVAEQLIRPTYLVDPEVELRPTKNQIDDLLNEIRRREEAGERVLVTTLTKKMAEDLTDYLLEAGVRARYLHSEIDTLERIQIIRELRLGEYDVLVGINLLREGLDLPEVSLVAILDADKEGFLRGKTALVQTIGRAARNVNGRVLLYADKTTEAIKGAMDETERRRAIQLAYNEEHGTTPISIMKGVSDIAEFLSLESPTVPGKRRRGPKVEGMSREELEKLAVTLEEEMYVAAEELRFEYAAKLRDEIKELRRELAALAEPVG